MVRILITYKINPSVSREEYREWSRTVDQPAASSQPGILGYEIYEVTSEEGGDGPLGDIVEVIDAESLEAWEAVDNAPEMKQAVAQFWEMCERESVRTLYTERLT